MSSSESEYDDKYFTDDYEVEPVDPINKVPRKYKEDDIKFTHCELAAMITIVLLAGYLVYEYEALHVSVVRFFANMGNQDAQHILGQLYYKGKGVPRNKTLAFYWFQQAAQQGHVHASYNLGVAHIQGFHHLERQGEAHDLIKYAASQGVKEAQRILKTHCARGECDR